MLSEMQTQPKKNFHDIDDTLERSLSSKWDAKLVDYDVEAYPFDKWMLGRIQAMGYPLEDLSNLHNVVPDGEAYKISKRLCADTNLPEFRHMLNKFVRNVVVPKGDLQLPRRRAALRQRPDHAAQQAGNRYSPSIPGFFTATASLRAACGCP